MRILPLALAVPLIFGAEVKRMNPDGLSKPTGYTHVVSAQGQRMIYISGQVALDATGKLEGKGDLAAQAEQVFKNLDVALTAAGATFADVIKLNFYVVNLKQGAMVPIRAVRNKYITGTPPASTAVGVQALVNEDFLLEVEAVAVK